MIGNRVLSLKTQSKIGRALLSIRNGVGVAFRSARLSQSSAVEPVERECFKEKEEECFDFKISPCQYQPKVVIVGGGIAGLSAAHSLIQCGYTKFVLLEASNRPGGRIHSALMDNRAVIEFGAQWIKGASMGNNVFTLACQANANEDRDCLREEPIDPQKFICFISDGYQVDPDLSMKAYQMFHQLERQAYSLHATPIGRGHGTLWNYLSERIAHELTYVPEDYRTDVSKVIYGLLNTIKCRWGADLREMSALEYGNHTVLPGPKIMLPTGLVNVLSPLIEKIPKRNIVFSKAVENIRWGGASTSVKCSDGDEIVADIVLVTVPLGVLKASLKTLFCPELPQEKQAAIEKLGWGHINKVFLDYNYPFWAPGEGSIRFSWSEDELDERCYWTRSIAYLEQLSGSPNTLVAVVGGKGAIEMESLTEDKIAEDITLQLRGFTGDHSIPYPSNLARTKWSCDPFILGANSYMAVESKEDHQLDLAAPLGPECRPKIFNLLFAGEATVPGHFSTVHGARLSGMREAQRILKMAHEQATALQSVSP